MKAAVIFKNEGGPQYIDFEDPIVQNDEQVLIDVKASAIKHFDKGRASGKHYSNVNDLKNAKVIGGDGVGTLQDGTRVYALGVSGMIAEKAVVEKNRMVKLPDRIDDAAAAALPNAVAGSAMALRFRAEIKKGETVLINGATGFTGKIAVQLAKHYGAGRIIVTGRNEESLTELLKIGADTTISINQEDESFTDAIRKIHGSTPIDIVLDYLWGHTAELILAALKGRGSFTHKIRYVSIGAMTGDIIQLSAENMRSVDLHLTGSGLGSWTKEQMKSLFAEILPEMFQLAADRKLIVDTINVALPDIERLWEMNMPPGKRLVIII